MKKLFILIFCMILLVGTVSATMEWDNVIHYEQKDGVMNKVAVIENAFGLPLVGSTIAKIELITPIHNLVIRGEDRRVLIFEIENYGKDYQNGIDIFDIINMRRSKKENKDYHLEYAIYKDVEVEDYETFCYDGGININGTIDKICEEKVIGTHIESQIVDWKILEGNIIPKGKITIALITDVTAGDYYDGIPDLFGKKIKSWAKWTESLNVGLVAYYKLDGTSGVVVDSLGISNGTNDGAERGASGIMGNAFDFVSSNTDTVTFPSTATVGGHGFTLSFWVYPHSDADCRLISQRDAQHDWQVYLYSAVAGNPSYFSKGAEEGNSIIPVQTNVWSHVMVTYNSTGGLHFYINGTETTSGSLSGVVTMNVNNIWLGTNNDGGEAYDGLVDELFMSDRTFSSDEAIQVYNEHIGVTWTDVFEVSVVQSFPAHNLFTTNTTMDFGCNFTGEIENITDVTILVYDSSDNLDYTNTESGLNIQNYNKTWLGNVLDDDTYSWACYGEGDSTSGYAGNRTFTIDSTAPIINITYPTTIVNYHIRGKNLTLNWSILDTTLESCWYNYNSTNISVNCSGNSTQFTVTEYANRNLTFYANDSLGHDSSEFISWDYKVFQTNVTYRSITTEGATETFGLDFTQVQAYPTSTVTLIYNDTDYSSIFSIIDNEVTGTNVMGIPNQNVASNPEFYWSILMSDGSVINTTTYNQTINILQVDDCSTYNHLIYNYTLLDEENQSRLSNTSIEIQLNLYDLSRRNLILNFSALYTDVNPAKICFNNSLLNTINYSVDSVVKYTSTNVSYSKEYYNILGDVFTNSTVPNHIYLYALLSADSTDFQLTFRDQSLSLAANVIVYVYRQYIADNDFKIVEAPLTDSNGQTVLHLVRNDVIYNFVMKDSSGEIIATFNKIIAFCQDYTIGSCEIDLSATGEGDAFYNYLEDVGISYSTSYSNVTELISFEFITDDLSAKTVQIDVTRNSDFGNRTVCQETLTSASGIITCDVSAITSTDRYLFIDITVDGDSKAKDTIDLEADSFNFGLYGSFIAFFIILIFVLMFMEDKQTLVIAIVLGWITVIALGLIKGKVVGVLSGTLWLIVSAIIFLWKLKQEESR